MSNEITSDSDYWKSTRKVIAARRLSNEKLGGVCPETDLGKCMEDLESGDQEEDETPPELPAKKRRCGKEKGKSVSEGIVVQDEILKRLDSIDRRLNLLDDLKKGLESYICKFPCRKQIVVPCCGRIVGCSSCVDQWLVNETRCPLCRIGGQMTRKIHLKGFEEDASFFRMIESPSDVEPALPVPAYGVFAVDDRDFEELPQF